MATGTTRFLITILPIFTLPLALVSCKQTTPQEQTQAEQKVVGLQPQDDQLVTRETTPFGTTPKPRAQVKRSVFDEWKDMRARRVPVGTKVRWRLKVWSVSTYSCLANLEGNWDYEVQFPRELLIGEGEARERVLKWIVAADGDWVEIQARFVGVTSRGGVMVDPYDFTNLGPGY